MAQVVLITGEPGQGKTYLADRLSENRICGIVHLDSAYVDFIRDRHPSLYLSDIACVVSQHYKTVLSVHRLGRSQWKKYVLALIKEELAGNALLIVEGYLLTSVLEDVLKSLPKDTSIVNVIVRDRRYYTESKINELQSWYL